MSSRPGIRWTIGDVAPAGFEALRLSVSGAWKLFGPEADYAICVNRIPLDRARQKTGPLPCDVWWHDATGDLPKFLEPHLGREMAEGAGWKFAPLRLFPGQPELALDNDCILWEKPAAVSEWLAGDGAADRGLTAEDVVGLYGQFSPFCGGEPRNGGIRGFPAGWDFAGALREMLRENPVRLESELDEQGLQTAAFERFVDPLVVTLDEVTICSPFPPHLPHLGSCGAHFCGLNARQLPWELDGRPATDHLRDHWQAHREAISRKVA